MNDQRPTRWPCSADSSRKAGPFPRSFRNADTGVSVSSITVWVIGISSCVPEAAIARTSSSEGVMTPVSGSRSAATLKEHLRCVAEREPPAVQQHGQVVEDVGGLFRHPLVALLARCARDLLGLLAH